MVYYYCPHIPRPVGGIKAIWQDANFLNQLGYPVKILQLHQKPTYFGLEKTPYEILKLEKYPIIPNLKDDDVIILPDILPQYASYFNCVKVEFFQGIIFSQTDRNFNHLLSNSKYVTEWIYEQFKKEAITVRRFIDTNIFKPKEKVPGTIAYMPRKNNRVVKKVIENFQREFEFIPIEDKTEQEVADILGKAEFYLTVAYPEGFNLPPAEAMACETIPIGFDGLGGREFMTPANSIVVDNMNTYALLEKFKYLKNVVKEQRDKMARLGRVFVEEIYNEKKVKADLTNFMNVLGIQK